MLICILTKTVITLCSVTMLLFLHLEVKPLMTLTTVLYLSCVLFFVQLFLLLLELTNRRWVSFLFVFMEAALGVLDVAGLGSVEIWVLDQGQLEVWGWRILFLIGIVLGGTAFILRRVLADDQQTPGHPEITPSAGRSACL